MDRAELGDRLAEQVPGLLGYARSITSDGSRADDLVQDTVVRALDRCDSFRGESSLATWLHRILHNLAVDQSRRSRETPVDLTDDGVGEQVDTLWANDAYTVDSARVLERAQTRDQLQDALLRLPLIYRSAVVLHDEEGLTMADIAKIQGVGLPAAKQRLRRGRMMLVSELADDGNGAAGRPELPMRCWDARHGVSDYLDEELSPRERSLLEAHLQSCPMCPPLYAGLVGVRDLLSGRRDPDLVVPSDLAARIARWTSDRAGIHTPGGILDLVEQTAGKPPTEQTGGPPVGFVETFAAVPSVDATTARALVRDGAVLLDVREHAEWDAGHDPQAVHLPLGRIAEVPQLVREAKHVVVVCRSGHRSQTGTRALIAMGYDAVNLTGGMYAWTLAGGLLVDQAGRTGSI